MYVSLEKGFRFHYRNNSTGKPTKAHIYKKESEETFCGFKDQYFGEEYPADQFTIHEMDCCKKCLSAYKKYNIVLL
jgi:hypothetical protein